MNIKALIKSLMQRQFLTGLLLLQLALTLGLIVNSLVLALDTRDKLMIPTGMDIDNILVVEALPTSAKFEDPNYYRSILDEDLLRLSEIDGVRAVSPQVQLPLQRGGWNGNFRDSAEDPDAPPKDRLLQFVAYYSSTADAIESFGLEIVEGRALTQADEYAGGDEELRNIVISQSLANMVYPDESPLGKLSNRGRIVGVVGDMLNTPSTDVTKQFFLFNVNPITMHSFTQHYVINVEPGKMAQARAQVADAILAVNPERDIMDVYTLKERHADYFENDTGLASLFAMLCVLMLVVTAISSFAHAQFHIAKQKKLIGIRRALGAKRKDILLYVLSENWLISFVGGVIGVGFVIAFNIMLSAQIEVSKPSIVLYLLAFVVVFFAGTLATWWPARQTSRIPPVIATRTI